METKSEQNTQIACLQKNLSAIRKIAGWTSEQLGERIGVTKQTISNLENAKTPMTLTQYIAIRSIIDFEMQTNKENTVLPQVVDVLLNREEEYTDEEREKISESVRTIAATASGGIGGTALAAVSVGLLGGILGTPLLAIGGVVAGSTWLAKILKGKDKNR
ncbi:helix-turn-helix transcriptional regulator [Paenibacillus sp. FSL H7-0716]|uniref:Transcriptional regulator n=1 Tax=Paenibacillus odorifer TaxID=189426 RepID=A0AB36JD11_9BACL|nr:helix-turn-helix transcriptional regulator [Paenibacillus odorifer]OME16586.1 transcriptional regulator [Paenibacillus odorifer]